MSEYKKTESRATRSKHSHKILIDGALCVASEVGEGRGGRERENVRGRIEKYAARRKRKKRRRQYK